MAEENAKTIYEVLGEQAALTSEGLESQEYGSEARVNEAKIFADQVSKILDCDRIGIEADYNQARIELEKYKIDQELKLKKEIELEKIKAEKITGKIDTGIKVFDSLLAVGSLVATCWFGAKTLRFNLEYGGIIGKDAKTWTDALKHFRKR